MIRERIFRALARVVSERPGTVLLVCGVLTLLGIGASGRIGMKTQVADMLPDGIPVIEEFEEIIDDYQSASTAMIAIESADKNTARMKECAEAVAQKLGSVKKLKAREGQNLSIGQKIALARGKHPVAGVVYDTLELVKRIDYKMDNAFFAEHGMMMQKPKDLKNFQDMFGSVALPELIRNINDNFEKEYIEDSDNLSTLDGEAEAVQGLEQMYTVIEGIGSYLDNKDRAAAEASVNRFITGPEYFISPDNSLLLVNLQPTVDMEDIEDGLTLGYAVKESVDVIQQLFPDLWIGASGWMVLQIDETESSKKDFGWPSLFALVLILMLLIGSFRNWKNPFYTVSALVVAIIWTTGILAVVLQYLNMMSAAFGIILIGLGIDFGIHVISGFRDGRENGLSVADAIAYMYNRVGAGVLTGALTTTMVFYSLVITRFKAFSEMGFAIGTGILVTLVVEMVMVPALIAWDNKGYSVVGGFLRRIGLGVVANLFNAAGKGVATFFNLGLFRAISGLMQFRFLEGWGYALQKMPVAVTWLIVSAVLVAASVLGFGKIEFEYDMLALEADGIPSVVTQEKILDKFEISPDYALLKSKGLEDDRKKLKQLKKIGNRTGLIGGVDGASEFVPPKKDQEKNRPVIEAFRKRAERLPAIMNISRKDVAVLVGELKRLHMNFVEIGELSVSGSGEDNKIVRKCDWIVGRKDEDSKILALAARLEKEDEVAGILSEYQTILGPILRDRLIKMTSTDEITLESLPEDIRNRYVNSRNDDLLITVFPNSNIWEETTLRKFQEKTSKVSERITGMPAIMLVYIDMMTEKGRTAVIVAAIAILLILLLDFLSVVYTVLAAVPLAAGAVWMVGMMAVFGIKFNIVNFMVLPLILGIGIDDGVHVLHRYRIEGRYSVPLVIRFTGRAILLTSLTTMIAFGSMGLASMKGVASMGQVLFIGVGACFVSSAFTLTALITVLEKFVKIKTDKNGTVPAKEESNA